MGRGFSIEPMPARAGSWSGERFQLVFLRAGRCTVTTVVGQYYDMYNTKNARFYLKKSAEKINQAKFCTKHIEA